MPRGVGKIQVMDFSGGLNDTNVATNIKDNELQTATNVFVNLRGGIEKRYGNTLWTAHPKVSSLTTRAKLAVFNASNFTTLTDNIIMLMPGVEAYNIGTDSASNSWGELNYTDSAASVLLTDGSGAVVLSGGTTNCLVQFRVNDTIRFPSTATPNTFYTISAIADSTNFTITPVWSGLTAGATFSVRKVGDTGSGLPCAEFFNGNTHYSLGTSSKMYYINSSNVITTIATPPSAAITSMAAHKNYLFAATTAGRVYWSALLDATSSTSWPSTNFVDVNPSSTGLRRLFSHNGMLYIFKDDGIWFLNGEVFDPANPQYSLSKIVNPQKIGCVHGGSVAAFQDKIVFLSTDGIYALDGVNRIINMSEQKIRTTIRGITNRFTPFTAASWPAIEGVVYDNRYWLSYATAASPTVNDTTLIMEPNGAFTTHTLITTNNWVTANTGSGFRLFGTKGAAGAERLFGLNGTETNDGSTAITATATTKIFGFGDFSKTTHVFDVYVSYYNTTNQAATLSVYDDAGIIGSSAAHTFPGGTTQFITVQRFVVDRDTNGLYLSVTDATSNSSFRILGIEVRYAKEMEASAKVITS